MPTQLKSEDNSASPVAKSHPALSPANKDAMTKKAHYAHHNAKARCSNQKNPSWPTYGGAGIKFLIQSPAALIAAIGLPKSKEESLDRIDPNGHYEIGNVRWTNKYVQEANKKASTGGTIPTPAQLVEKFEESCGPAGETSTTFSGLEAGHLGAEQGLLHRRRYRGLPMG